MILHRLVILTVLLCVASPALAKKFPKTIIYSPEVMVETKRRVQERDPLLMPAYKALLQQADRALKAPAESVVFKTILPPGGEKHDYWSAAPYWWPDPASHSGRPYIRHDGERNPETASKKYDRERLRRTASNALTLALAWYLSGNEEYAGKGSALIWAWCCDSVTRMTPNMDFAQMRPGKKPDRWAPSPSGLIEGRELIKIVEAARILEPSHAWSNVVTKKLQAWFTDYVRWMQTSSLGRKEAGALNHHGTWYDAQLAVFSVYIGKVNLARTVVGNTAPKRLVMQVERNGAMPLELDRTRSRYYTFFNLEAYFTLAAVGDRVSIDLWNWSDPTGISLRKAFDFAAPYLAKNEPWPFGDIGQYDPDPFIPLFQRAAMVYKDGRYRDFLKALPADEFLQNRAQLFY